MPKFENDPFGAVFEAVDVGFIILDRDRRTIAWNAWLEAASGIRSEHAAGKQLEELFPRPVVRLRSAISGALDSGSASLLTHALNPVLLPLRTRAGRELIHDVSVRPIGERPYSRCLIQISDVTVAVGRERVLRERQNARYDAVVNSAPDAIVTLDEKGVIQLANPSAAQEFGYASDELVGRPLAVLFRDLTTWNEVWRAVANGEILPRPVEIVAVRKDGSPSYLEVSASRWLSNSRVFVTAILRDVNERRAAEEALLALNQSLERRVQERTGELMVAEEQLRQSQKMEAVGQLTGGIAHDFNNLLAGIVGSLDLMQTRIRQGRTEAIPRYAEAAMSSAQRAAALTHRLLAFSRRQPLDPKPVDANQLVASMEDLLRRTIGPAIQLDFTTANQLWPTLCDPNQLENAILNLAINARDAMPSGGTLLVRTENTQLDRADAADQQDVRPGPYVMISIADTGTGMEPEVLARAFDPFFTTKPMGQGTGLGLSMVYGFVKQSEGHIRITSEEGRGTIIAIYLPRFNGLLKEQRASTVQEGAPKAERGETVLIIEDEPVVRSLISEVLQDFGYRIVEASDGPAGLKILNSNRRIDLLVTDVGLPGLDGRQVANLAREGRPQLKVLFITGYAENAAQAAGFLEPGMEMITKPFAIDVLAQRVCQMIGQREGAPRRPND